MGMGGGGSKGIKSEINVTPLVDVVLVLLIIFMVVTPMLQRGKDVELPQVKGDGKEQGSQADPMILSLTHEKKTYLEQDEYDAPSLERAIRAKLDAAPGQRILLKADKALTFGDVRKVLNLARKAGSKGVGMGVEEVKK